MIKKEVDAAIKDHPELFQLDYGYDEVASDHWKSVPLIFTSVHKPSGQQLKVYESACQLVPQTIQLLSDLHAEYQLAGDAMLSVLVGGGYLAPHRDSPTGMQTAHLGLLVPPDYTLHVGDEIYTWKEGESVVFDPSFLHEAHNLSDEPRIVMLVDVWHPEWTLADRKALIAYTNWKSTLTPTEQLKLLALPIRTWISGPKS